MTTKNVYRQYCWLHTAAFGLSVLVDPRSRWRAQSQEREDARAGIDPLSAHCLLLEEGLAKDLERHEQARIAGEEAVPGDHEWGAAQHKGREPGEQARGAERLCEQSGCCS